MQSSKSGFAPALGIVVALHAAALAWLLAAPHEPRVAPLIESKPIVAELLSPEARPTPAIAESKPQPSTKPQMLPKLAPKPTPKAVDRKVAPAPTPAPTPTPVAAAPSPIAPATPGQTTPTAAPAAAPTVAESAPARPTLGISTPKGVTKLECGIVRPDYPSASRRRGETGTVVVNFVLGVDGKVERANIKKSSGYDRLDDAARTAVLDSSCKPYVENGQPIRVTKDQPFVFNLDE